VDRKSAPPSRAWAIHALARRQHGLITRPQLRQFGVGDKAVAAWVRDGRLRRLHRGVYVIGQAPLRKETHWLAAVLACGPGAVLSHRSAAALWEIRADSATRTDVTVPTRNGRRAPTGIRVHRSGRLSSGETLVREGIPATTVARTLLDLAETLSDGQLKRTIDESEYRRLFDLNAIIAVVEDNPGRRGGARLRRLAGGPEQLTESHLEDRMLDLIYRYELRVPLVAHWLEEEYRADFYWPEACLVVETDGGAAHRTRRAFVNDRTRDRRLLAAGIRTIRVTEDDFEDEAALVSDLELALGARANGGGAPSLSRP
jgi:very-short-patch-repair endonuclease